MHANPPADIGRTTRCFRERWRIYSLGEEVFIYNQSAARLLKVRLEFVQLLLTGDEIDAQSMSSLLGMARSDG